MDQTLDVYVNFLIAQFAVKIGKLEAVACGGQKMFARSLFIPVVFFICSVFYSKPVAGNGGELKAINRN